MDSFTLPVENGKFRIHYFPELESTNDQAASCKYRHGDVIVCGSQSKGRGQRGNGWHSQPGANLTFSVVIEPTFLGAENHFFISRAASLAVVDTLAKFGMYSQIKWPNDIYIGNRKIAGILIENDICGSNISRSVVGIGLNVNQSKFPQDLPNPVSMAGISGLLFDLTELLGIFLGCFETRINQIKDNAGALIEEYDKFIYLKNTETLFRRQSGEEFTGIIRDVKPGGELVVETETATEEFLFKEIEFVM